MRRKRDQVPENARGNPQVTPLDVNLSHLWTHRSFSSL